MKDPLLSTDDSSSSRKEDAVSGDVETGAPHDLDKDLEVALEAARRAARVALAGFRKPLDVKFKSKVDLVTQYDVQAEEAALGFLRSALPQDAILAEESGGKIAAEGRLWCVDPLDGTTNFAHGFPAFAASVGLLVDGEPVVGAVVAPAMGWEFTALRGGGAFLNGEPIRVSRVEELAQSLLVTGFPYSRVERARELGQRVEVLVGVSQGLRRIGAAALDLCFVGAGWIDAQWEDSLNPWDVAAGIVVALEAGGRVTDWSGGPVKDAVAKGELAASNGRIHDELLAAVNRVKRK